ncbi:MAG: AmmeMemoRadiSam system protein B [Candidatus Omnitrophica bacterium]|nr:AmmeMemoRadiSam system protein B [Candidatus Omnitrophota bacterium]
MNDQQARQAAVAGQFYPGDKKRLDALLAGLLPLQDKKQKAIGVISPHAGYVYSGKVAGKVLSRVSLPDTLIILGPNHTGYGPAYSIMKEGTWQTPLGEIAVDASLAEMLLSHCRHLTEDRSAHFKEHSIEVQLPFLQYLKKTFTFVPIVLATGPFADLQAIGLELAQGITECNREALIIVSSDMNHYETHQTCEKKDALAIDAIRALDAQRLFEVVRDHNITMCGYAPTIAMIECARQLGATEGILVDYQTSGSVSGDYDSVVGYAGIIIV